MGEAAEQHSSHKRDPRREYEWFQMLQNGTDAMLSALQSSVLRIVTGCHCQSIFVLELHSCGSSLVCRLTACIIIMSEHTIA